MFIDIIYQDEACVPTSSPQWEVPCSMSPLLRASPATGLTRSAASAPSQPLPSVARLDQFRPRECRLLNRQVLGASTHYVALNAIAKKSSPTRLIPAIVRHTIVFQHKFPYHTLLLVFGGRARRETKRGFFSPLPLRFWRGKSTPRLPPFNSPLYQKLQKMF